MNQIQFPNCVSVVFILFVLFPVFVVPVRRNTEQLNIGFIFSLPYDISNTLRAPIAGPVSLALAAALALIMFFGLLATPLYYFLGWPERDYYIHDAAKDPMFNHWIMRAFLEPEAFEVEDSAKNSTATVKHPGFMESVFLLFPTIERQCQLLMVCHAHGFLRLVPKQFVEIYRFFSKKLIEIEENLRTAILIGLEDQGECAKLFNNCKSDLTSISRSTFIHIVSNLMEVQDNKKT